MEKEKTTIKDNSNKATTPTQKSLPPKKRDYIPKDLIGALEALKPKPIEENNVKNSSPIITTQKNSNVPEKPKEPSKSRNIPKINPANSPNDTNNPNPSKNYSKKSDKQGESTKIAAHSDNYNSSQSQKKVRFDADAQSDTPITRVPNQIDPPSKKQKLESQTLLTPVTVPYRYNNTDWGKLAVTESDRKRLVDGMFLNDTLIEFYLKYIAHQLLPESLAQPYSRAIAPERVYFFNTFFFTDLLSSVPELHSKPFVKKAKLLERDWVFIPINKEHH